MPLARSIALLLSGAALALALSGCSDEDVGERVEAPSESPVEAPGEDLAGAPPILFEPVDFADLPGWTEDSHAEALPPLRRSCDRLLRRDDTLSVGPDGLAGTVADWRGPCEALALVDADYAPGFFQDWFRPFAVSEPGDDTPDEGLFTGYYEAELAASESPGDGYDYPILALPEDLVTVRLRDFRADLPPERLVGRVEGGSLVPYHDRTAIETGRLDGLAEPLLWAKDPVDLHILQIQGSGLATLPNGETLRIGFAGSNGQPFVGFGRVMLDRGLVEPGKGSMQDMRAWLKANPASATEIMRENPRYIFFRRIEGEGPIGALGVPLTPQRSLAIDPRLLPLGAPIWLATTRPGPDETPLRRLMVAQDTGSAIVGAVRGDFYWGTGEAALDEAGRMAERGRYWLLLPKTVAERREATG
ncbi:murein transglycosylase A [Algihabitans albus]|uniref:murein transglycosylase A n=1 Tax=Algihabitans albus TaxID=2164067 RepID=UPI000E5D1F6C|nr:MltA domain-containing protein [Algihabitans albus]